MADTATEIDLDSVIDRLLEGEFGLPIFVGASFRQGKQAENGAGCAYGELSSLDFRLLVTISEGACHAAHRDHFV